MPHQKAEATTRSRRGTEEEKKEAERNKKGAAEANETATAAEVGAKFGKEEEKRRKLKRRDKDGRWRTKVRRD